MSTPRPQLPCFVQLKTGKTIHRGGCGECSTEGVAAPLEPTQIAARKFRIDKGINDGTMMSGTWIDAIMAEFAAAVSKNQLAKYEKALNLTVREFLGMFDQREEFRAKIVELEKEIAALRQELSDEINAPGRTDF